MLQAGGDLNRQYKHCVKVVFTVLLYSVFTVLLYSVLTALAHLLLL